MRALRVAAPRQLSLPVDLDEPDPGERWWDLPEPARATVLRLLAQLISRGVLVDETVESTGPGADHG